MTNDEIIAAIEVALENALKIAKGWFPTLLGHGLSELSKDQRVFTEASNTMGERLIEKNRDDEYFIDEGDRVTGDYNLKNFRSKFTSR